ncbi:nuclear mitotic apparatus protein [Pimephales promelas]|nr:nuclear mitotic apparatus protein [Pimephales promelas]
MELNGVKEAALLSWINSVCPEEPINKITQMMDGHRLLELADRLRENESGEDLSVSPAADVMEMLFSVLQNDFKFSPRQASLMFQKISQGVELELQIAKVVLVLCYCSFKRHNMVPLDIKTGLMISSMFHFVEEDADGVCLVDDLNKFLTKASVMTFSTSSSGSSCGSPSYSNDESPFTSHFHKPRPQCLELVTVAGGSDSSPVPNKVSTPQLLKRLRNQLAHGADVRDELANQINVISEKEGLIVQLKHRVDRMLREQRELERGHKAALLGLQEKNESLLRRVHEVLGKCREIKTENYQKDKRIYKLTDENRTFAAQARNAFAQLARAEEEVTKLTSAHESSLAEWRSRKEFLEHELNEAVTHRECLSEQVQILQGKISVLEDELLKAQSQERGEVLGPIMEASMED